MPQNMQNRLRLDQTTPPSYCSVYANQLKALALSVLFNSAIRNTQTVPCVVYI